MSTPTAMDVVAFLNERFAFRGLPYRVDNIDVLPYVNPMWMANWDVPQLAAVWNEIEDDVREARWQFPQVLPSA
jgi:hypothetical protein